MSLPPGPALSAMELAPRFLANPFDLLKECKDKFGPIFTLELGDFGMTEFGANGKWVFLSNPQHVRQLYSADSDVIHAGEANALQFGKLLPPTCSTLLDEAAHVVRRRFLLAPFQDVRQHVPMISSVVKDVVAAMPDGEVFPLVESLKVIAKDSITRAIFGLTDDAEVQAVTAVLVRLESPHTSHEEMLGMVRNLGEFARRRIVRRRAEPYSADDTDLFSYMVFTRDKSDKHLSDEDLQDELVNLLIGGVGTTAAMSCWAFAWILSQPEVHARLLEELNAVLGGARSPSVEMLDRLEYLDAVITESMRISPFFFNSSLRLLKRELQIGDHLLPPGTLVANCSYLLHMNPEVYEEPEVFRPARFFKQRPNPSQWAPFGGGARRCVGHLFATQEMKLIVALVLSSVELKLASPETATRAEPLGPFYGPSGGAPVRVVRRL